MKKTIDFDIIQTDLLMPISKKFNIPYIDLLKILNNIKIFNKKRIFYNCEHDFFSKNNEKSFYWAGFIAADGCVFQQGNSKSIHLGLAKKDLDHLLKFKNDINFNGKVQKRVIQHSITNPKWNDSVIHRISVTSGKMFTDLGRFNIVPNKTKILTFPNWIINHELAHHFLRGYIDGDGCFWHDTGRNRICLEIRGTFDFLTGFKTVIENSLDVKYKFNVNTPDSTSKISCYSKNIMPKIVSLLYDNASIYMPRKKDIAIKSYDIKLQKKRYYEKRI